jgi:membrane protein implicated in regulation of membrane protease activity
MSLIIFLGFIEAITVNLVSVWFVISGIVALILSFITDNFVIQFGTFVILGIILLATTRSTLEKILVKKEKTNLDRIIGMMGIVTEDIPKNEIGEVRVDGKRWSAVSKQSLKKGDKVKILKINSVKLEVESWEE